MKQSFDPFPQSYPFPAVRRIGLGRPFAWLGAGLDDVLANPLPSLAYGLLFSIGADMILLAGIRQPLFFVFVLSGFFLVGPFLAAGLYELSRQREYGGNPMFFDSLRGLKRSATPLALFGLVPAVIIGLWQYISHLAFAGIGNVSPDIRFLIINLISSGEHQAFVAVWFFAGAMLALLTFAVSAVAVPMILDRQCSPLTAMITSLHTFALNLEALALWGMIVVALTLLGFGTLLAGLVIVMPILGHATWHAYRELVQ